MKIPFTPAIYEHAARLIGRSPWEVSRDADLMFQGHLAAYQLYRHQTVAVGIDIYNLEAEAYGARIEPAEGNAIPAIHEPFFQSVEDALDMAPFNPKKDGRISMVIEAGRRLKSALPQADVRIPVAGPFSIGVNLRGITGLCEEVGLQPELVGRWLMRLAENQAVFCQAVVEAGLDVAFFESAAAPPLLSPRQFREVELPALKRALAIAEGCVHHPVPCIMGGDVFRIYDELMSTGTSFVVCNVETNQTAFVARARDEHPRVRIRVNMDPVIVACSDRDRICREVDRIVTVIGSHPNCLIGTGALPFETPPENVRLIREHLETP